jgi:hypothetical protein
MEVQVEPAYKKKAGLEMTAQDHLDIGSTPLKVLVDNPGKTYLETMTEDQLRAFIFDQVSGVEETHEGALKGDPMETKILRLLLRGFLVPNIEYLRRIGRLPKELKGLNPKKKFAIPRKRSDS